MRGSKGEKVELLKGIAALSGWLRVMGRDASGCERETGMRKPMEYFVGKDGFAGLKSIPHGDGRFGLPVLSRERLHVPRICSCRKWV